MARPIIWQLLIYRKVIVAEEIKHNRRLVELIRRTQN